MPLMKLLPLSEMITQKKGKEKFHNEHFTEHQTFLEHVSPTHSLIKVSNGFAILFHARKTSKVSKSVHPPVFSCPYMNFVWPDIL